MEQENNNGNTSAATGEEKKSGGKSGSNFMIPGAIIFAGLIIAGAVLYSGGGGNGGAGGGTAAGNTAKKTAASEDILVRPVNADDHILGSPDAPIVIVEFSDLECPFCQRFHETMKQVMEEYGEDGNVAWVYRHFPLEALHSKAPREAEATECAAELGGNSAFWRYTDRIFEITPSNNGLNLALLPQIAEEIGLDRNAFNECLESGRVKKFVQEDITDAETAGGRGTPYSVVLTKDGKKIPIPGAQPYTQVKRLVDQLLAG